MSAASASTGLDHVILGCADLRAGVGEIRKRLDVQMATGGSHAGLGTRNALAGLGDGTYLELLAPDPAQPPTPLSKMLSALPDVAPFHWAVRSGALAQVKRLAESFGVESGDVVDGSRVADDGAELRWQLLFLTGARVDATAPFFIDWQQTARPGDTLEQVASIESFDVAGPFADSCNRLLSALDVEYPRLRPAPLPSLSLTLMTERHCATFATHAVTQGVIGW